MPDQPANPSSLVGIYLLTIRLGSAIEAVVGRRQVPLPAGWFVYTGSALGGLRGRLGRHLGPARRPHWHVDALLDAGKVADVQILATGEAADECRAAAAVRGWPGAVAVPGFGASDCRCPGHLCHFRERPGGSLLAPAVLQHLPDIYRELRRRYLDHAALDRDPFATLVACILSLRTQDPVTEAAAARLASELRTPQDFAAAAPERIAKLIYPVGMYRQKALRLVEIARQILARFGGRTPAEIDELTSLPGVGRKTANLVRSFAWHLPAVCVDTHVHRIANRWGLVRTATPEQTETMLRAVLPQELWSETNGFLVQHGQQVCRPTGPRCGACLLQDWCGYRALLLEHAVLAALPGAPAHPSLRPVQPATAAAGARWKSPFIPQTPTPGV